ncbi:MAG: hypothetical protein H6Q14_3055, partial [Bacteroidetes bacterium]|nr:hypothetical protein [Bacteroidota bacterium]
IFSNYLLFNTLNLLNNSLYSYFLVNFFTSNSRYLELGNRNRILENVIAGLIIVFVMMISLSIIYFAINSILAGYEMGAILVALSALGWGGSITLSTLVISILIFRKKRSMKHLVALSIGSLILVWLTSFYVCR